MLPTQQLKQIGNAVPIPLGVALGKELGKALVIMWKQMDKIAEEEREASPEAEMYEFASCNYKACMSGSKCRILLDLQL